jgi:hypothetical protein
MNSAPGRLVGTACILFVTAATCSAADKPLAPLAVSVKAGPQDRISTPAVVTLQLPADCAEAKLVTLTTADGRSIPGQLTAPSLLNATAQAEGFVVRELHFIVPSLKQGESLELTATIAKDPPAEPSFAWKDTPGEYTDLVYDGRPVMRYMYKAFDGSSKESRELTYKPFHHLYDPAGTRFVTNGGPDGEYPHHRGLFYGFRDISHGDQKNVNTWYGAENGYEEHSGFLAAEAGPVLGRHLVGIDWHGPDPVVFATEKRELTAYAVAGGTLVEFASRLSSQVGKVKLDGDPQHGGFQFRAADEVAQKSQKETYYLRPDGKGGLGETRNWDAKTRDPACVNLPWNAVCFVLGGQRFTVVYLDHPSNPKEARYSEREYARFGSYFEYELDKGKDLDLRYRIWLQSGEMTVEQAAALSRNFVEPVEVVVHAP